MNSCKTISLNMRNMFREDFQIVSLCCLKYQMPFDPSCFPKQKVDIFNWAWKCKVSSQGPFLSAEFPISINGSKLQMALSPRIISVKSDSHHQLSLWVIDPLTDKWGSIFWAVWIACGYVVDWFHFVFCQFLSEWDHPGSRPSPLERHHLPGS